MCPQDEKPAHAEQEVPDSGDELDADELEDVSGGVLANKTIMETGPGAMSFPDVCSTPTPGGPVPIPYPDSGQSGDTSSGTKKVKTGGSVGGTSGGTGG